LKVLVTGATGFVGVALVSRLVNSGRLGVRAAVRRESSALFAGAEQVVTGDLAPNANWQQALVGVDAVVHLAARVHVMHDDPSDPLAEFRRVNADGTLSLARQAAAAGVRRFIFLSSIKVNGESTLLGHAFTAGDVPVPQDPYGISKHEAELGLRQLAAETGMEMVIIRPPLVYGPGVKANFLNMMHWLHKGVPLPFGAIHNRRSLVALDNLVDLIIACLDRPAAANQTFLVSDGEDLSTTELLRRMALALNVPARLLPVPQKLLQASFSTFGKCGLTRRLCGSLQVDIAKTCTMLDWKPPITVDEGLRRTAEDFLRGRG